MELEGGPYKEYFSGLGVKWSLFWLGNEDVVIGVTRFMEIINPLDYANFAQQEMGLITVMEGNEHI